MIRKYLLLSIGYFLLSSTGFLFSQSLKDDQFVQIHSGEIQTQTDTISGLEKLNQKWNAHTDRSRLFISPTARPVPKKSFTYNNQLLFMSSAKVGITKHFSVSGGLSTFPRSTFFENWNFIMTRFGIELFPSHYVSLSSGYNKFNIPFRIHKLIYTLSGKTANLTAGVQHYNNSTGSTTGIIFGGEIKNDRSGSLIIENIIFNIGDLSNSYNLHLIGGQISSKRTSMSLAIPFISSYENDVNLFNNRNGRSSLSLIPIPYIDFSIHF